MGRFIERSLVLLKPDAVKRGIIGEIIARFERPGLKIIAFKMIKATREQLERHLPIQDSSWIRRMGEKNIQNNRSVGIDPTEDFETNDPMEIGRMILEWNFDYLLSGPILAMVLEGVGAIKTVRKIIGDTIPADALPGTIRGDFSINSAAYDNYFRRSCFNIVHASGNENEAEREISAWFREEELLEYERNGGQKPQTPVRAPIKAGSANGYINNIENVFESEVEKDPRNAAELAFAIALAANNAGQRDKSIKYGKAAITLLKSLGNYNEEAMHVEINGILLPDYINPDIIRSRLNFAEIEGHHVFLSSI